MPDPGDNEVTAAVTVLSPSGGYNDVATHRLLTGGPQVMNLIRRSIPAAAALIGVAVLAGCGGSSPSTTSSTAASQPSGDIATQAYKYAACMRDHGVSNFPDPKVSTSPGHKSVAMVVSAAVVDSPQFKTAQTGCRSILPGPSKADLAAQARQQQVRKQGRLAFARCLRNHGISGFPDPNSQGELTLPMVQAAGIDLTAPQVRTAALACVAAANGAITRAQVLQATSGNPPKGGSTAQSGPPSP
jgi:hypothetical protein